MGELDDYGAEGVDNEYVMCGMVVVTMVKIASLTT